MLTVLAVLSAPHPWAVVFGAALLGLAPIGALAALARAEQHAHRV